MKKVLFLTSDRKHKRDVPPAYCLLFMLAGMYGSLMLLQAVPDVRLSFLPVFAAGTVFCIGLWAIFFYRRKRFLRYVFLMVLIGGIFGVIARENLTFNGRLCVMLSLVPEPAPGI